MPVPGVRTSVVAVLAAAVAIRVTATQPLTGAYARIAPDPAGALSSAADGWTVAGSLGDATAQGLREVPLAAFLWLTDVLGMAPGTGRTGWAVLVLVLAAVGAVRLGRGSRTPAGPAHEVWTPWAGAALFACAPVLVTAVQHAPGDALVVAVLPWVLAPIVSGDLGWRTAASSAAWLGLAGAGSPMWAVAALAAGLVSAVATSRRPGGGRQLARWSLLAAASCTWWLAAAVWESSYAAAVTDLVTTSLSVEELAAAVGLGSPTAVVSALLLLGPALVAVSAVALRVGRDRDVVAALLALVAVAVALGLLGGWPSWLPIHAAAVSATDVVPAPWTVLTGLLCLAALLAWTPLVDHLWAQLPDPWSWSQPTSEGTAAAGLALLGVLSVAGPVLAVQVDAPGPAGPDRWAALSTWSRTAPPGRVLVLPATTEGRTDPAVAQALRGRPWIARDTLPVSGARATTALDAALGRLDRGHDGEGTAAALRQLGVSYVLLRNDVPAAADRERPLGLVRHALSRQGASRVAVIGADGPTDDLAPETGIVDLGLRDPLGSFEIWAVDNAADGTVRDGAALAVAGGPQLLSDLADAGLGGPALIVANTPEGSGGVVSDSERRQDIDLRMANDPTGPVLGGADARTVVPSDAAVPPTASRRLSGAQDVRSSSSAADLDSSLRLTGAVAAAAIDGNAFTAWQSRRGTVTEEWWEITFESARDLSAGVVQVVPDAFASYQVTRVRLESDNGASEVEVPATGTVPLTGVGRTARLRVVATGVAGTVTATSRFAISELTVPGLEVDEGLVVEGADAGAWVVAARPPSLDTCLPSFPIGGAADPRASETVCNRAALVDGPDSGRIARVLRSSTGGEVSGRAWARSVDSVESTRLAEQLARPSVVATASSVASADLVTAPQSAVDTDPGTAWRPSTEDAAPALTLTWDRPALVTGVRVSTAAPRLASPATRVTVSYGDSDRTASGEVGADGAVNLPAVRTRQMTLTFESLVPKMSTDSLTGAALAVPIAISEVEVLGGPEVRYDADDVTQLECGSGPEVTVGGESYETAVRTSARQVVESSVVQATLCERPVLGADEVPVTVEASFSWIPLGLVLSRADGPLGEVDRAAVVDDPGALVPVGTIATRPDDRVVDVVGDGPATLALAVPAGKGWTAVADGRELPSLTVDGWAQAWTVPEGASRVTVRYASGEALRWTAGAASSGWALVVVLALWSPAGSRRAGPRRRGRRDHSMVGRSTHT